MWLLLQAVFDAMQRAVVLGMTPTVEQQLDFEARAFGTDGEGGPRLLTVAGNNAEIAITGVLTATPNFLAMLFGGGNTTYAEINAALAAAEQDDAIENITLAIDSPGGQTDGLFDTLATIQAVKKPITAVITNKATSAAFALASQADKVIANNRAVMLGSIGVAVAIRVDDTLIDIASTDASKKRPDVTTEAGKAEVRELLDSMHTLFVEAIAEGRGTDVENVNANFGQGATLLADDALKRGMIDSIAGSPLKAVKATPAAASGDNLKEAKAMDLVELKSKHLDVYTAAVQEGTEGILAKERDRVNAFLVAGAQSGDMKTALDAIKNGSEMTATLSTTFLMAASNRGAVETRTAEEIEAAAALENAGGSDEEKDLTASKALTSAVFEACGAEEVTLA